MRNPRTSASLSVALLLLGFSLPAVLSSGRGSKIETPQTCATEPDVSIRLYYNPMVKGEGTAHSPCIFLPVSVEDPRLGTRPAWILYDSLSDVQAVLKLLSNQHFDWMESPDRAKLVVEPFELPQPQHTSMQIAVGCPHRSATTQVRQEQICALLSDISKLLENPKAKQSFDTYRRSVSCEVRD
jgi:hypothetical protein